MQNREDKLLLGFLGFSILVCLVSIVFKQDFSIDMNEDSSKMDPDISMVGTSVDSKHEGSSKMDPNISMVGTSVDSKHEGSLNMDPNTSMVRALMNPKAVLQTALQREISLESYSLQVEGATHWKLPGRLKEISGLAMTLDNRLLGHADEKGIIYEIDYQNGLIVKAFQLADIAAPVADDFEGIATVDNRVYLVTSSGRLYECSEGADDESVLFNIYATGVGRDCEIEGLAYDASQRALLLMCKESRRAELKEQVAIYHWSTDEKQLSEDAHTVIPVIEFSRHIEADKFQPSGIERHPASGNYFVIAARQRAIAEITPAGQVVAVKPFPAEWHRQTEGITFAADGALIIADEGAGRKARLTVYPVSESRQ